MKPRIYFDEGSWWCEMEAYEGTIVYRGWSRSPRGAYLDFMLGISFCKLDKSKGSPTLKALYQFRK